MLPRGLLYLTAQLVASELPRVVSYDNTTVGLTTHAVVHAIRPKSILMELLGGVRGIVRGSELKARFGGTRRIQSVRPSLIGTGLAAPRIPSQEAALPIGSSVRSLLLYSLMLRSALGV